MVPQGRNKRIPKPDIGSQENDAVIRRSRADGHVHGCARVQTRALKPHCRLNRCLQGRLKMLREDAFAVVTKVIQTDLSRLKSNIVTA